MTTADKLRADINRGRTGDKVPFHDPAAAPLGTDDEAAGATPTPEQVETARAQEGGRDSRNALAVSDERSRGYNGEAYDHVPEGEAPSTFDTTGTAPEDAMPEGQQKVPSSWPHGKRRNMRAAIMLGGAVVLMGVVLSVWAALMA